ncbi:MAG: REP-associated tyrosine transposase [Gammaproteobacteria bacterium]
MPNYRRYYFSGHTVFITVVTLNRDSWLRTATSVELLLASMRKVKGIYPYRHAAHVILPDHLHWMFTPLDTGNCSRIVAAVKREVSWQIKRQGLRNAKLWQPRFYGHLIRNEMDFARHLDYLHFNPVKHGYVTQPAAYAYASFSEWVDKGVYTPDWGASGIPPNIQDLNFEYRVGKELPTYAWNFHAGRKPISAVHDDGQPASSCPPGAIVMAGGAILCRRPCSAVRAIPGCRDKAPAWRSVRKPFASWS